MKQLVLLLSIFISGISVAQTEEIIPPPPPEPADPVIEVPEDRNIGILDEPAQFPGGQAAMQKFIKDNLVYPKQARENEIEGRLYLKFIVEVDGTLTDITVVRKLAGCPECDAEAIRVVKLMPNWIPGKHGDKAVRSYYNLPFTFRIP